MKVIRSISVIVVIIIRHMFAVRNEVLSIKTPIIGELITFAVLVTLRRDNPW